MGQRNGKPTAGYRLPQCFKGERVFLLGGGPSLTAEIAERVRGRPAMAINATARLAPWADVLFFGDHGFFRDHRPIVDNWPKIVITSSRRAFAVGRNLILVVPPTVQAKTLSSGHHAVDVLLAMGAKEIVLLGFDCRIDEAGRSHNHEDYKRGNPKLYSDIFLPAWAEYPARAEKRGARIINATPHSAIDCFERVSLEEMLAELV